MGSQQHLQGQCTQSSGVYVYVCMRMFIMCAHVLSLGKSYPHDFLEATTATAVTTNLS